MARWWETVSSSGAARLPWRHDGGAEIALTDLRQRIPHPGPAVSSEKVEAGGVLTSWKYAVFAASTSFSGAQTRSGRGATQGSNQPPSGPAFVAPGFRLTPKDVLRHLLFIGLLICGSWICRTRHIRIQHRRSRLRSRVPSHSTGLTLHPQPAPTPCREPPALKKPPGSWWRRVSCSSYTSSLFPRWSRGCVYTGSSMH